LKGRRKREWMGERMGEVQERDGVDGRIEVEEG